MRVRIVSYEDINAWILGKFARRLCEELLKSGVNADIANVPDHTADINHHIIYLGYKYTDASPVDTLMITHIDDVRKLDLLKEQMHHAKAGICMSRSMMLELSSTGIPANKLLYINPAHDNVMKPRKLVIGITSKVQPDGCKREHIVQELFNHISPDTFSLSIMGSGWDKIVEDIRSNGFTVNYFEEFDYEKYVSLVPTFDYYLYTGQDEGSMGFIDALAAGVKTIVTPQGYHLDAPGGIVHAFNELDELLEIFKKIELEKKALENAVGFWTWKDYALKHVEVWNYLLNNNRNQQAVVSRYNDGLNSMLGKKEIDPADAQKFQQALAEGTRRRKLFKAKKIFDIPFVIKKIKGYLNKDK